MTGDASNSLVSLGDLSKPVNTFIEKISGAVGMLFEPYQMVRMAKAGVKADIIRAEGAESVSEIQQRAVDRLLTEEIKRQENIEKIASKAVPLIEENSSAENMDDDWIANFFDKSKLVSDEGMQQLWANILAGEANSPGSYSKRTVNFISGLDKVDAENFSKLCSFAWRFDAPRPVIFNETDDVYKNVGLSFDILNNLDSIGLITFDPLAGYLAGGLPDKFVIVYQGRPLTLTIPNGAKKSIETGKVLMTRLGQEVASLCSINPVDGFYEYCVGKWGKYIEK